jgi:RNA polymerase sigma-32 factor
MAKERKKKRAKEVAAVEAEVIGRVEDEPAQERALERFDPLRRYMEEVRHHPLLTPDEEHELAVRFRETQDPALAHRLVTANLRLVVKIANEYRSHWTNLLDLVQEGNVGLLQAVKRYDPFRGVRLSSYAQYWIRAYIIYYLLANFRLVKVGTTQAQRKLFFRLQRAREKLLAMGVTPGAKLLAEKLDVTEQDVQEMSARLDSPEISLDATPPGSDQPALKDSLRSGAAGPEMDVSEQEIRARISAALAKFADTLADERERTIWAERLVAEDPVTLQDIGSRFGVSRERARQLEERLKKRARDFLQKELGGDVRLEFLGS